MPPPRTSRRRSSLTNGTRIPIAGNTSKTSDSSEVAANISTKRTPITQEDARTSPTKTAFEDGGSGARRPSARNVPAASTPLETVQESSSVPSTPSNDKTDSARPEEPTKSKAYESLQQAVESGSESGGNKSSESKEEARKASSTTRPAGAILPQKSFTSLNSARGKPGDGSVHNMIVETETVSSIPQVSLGVGAGERGTSNRNDQGGTLRMKPSVETIRPRKEKKRTVRKTTNVPGVASSKADIFEAKVASAIDDADVSDSDETFVYESNPPEQLPPRRYHSRTPSTTSMASQADQFTNRSRLAPRDGNGVTVKRSMKFTNNYNSNLDGDLGDVDQRSVSGRGDNNTHSTRHHHMGRHGRGGGYPSLFDSDSPFPSQNPPPRSPRHYIGNGFRQSRRGFTPRSHPNYRTLGGPKSMSDEYIDDFDADGADDERTPLVNSSIRMSRNRNGRRPGSASMRQMEYLERQRNCFSRYGGCIIATFLIMILVGGAATFFAALTRPLLEIKVTKLSNVLASQQEIIVDVHISAINPNIFPISIAKLDADIFAKSRYVGSDKFWRDHGPHPEDFPRVERSNLRARLAQLVRSPLSEDSNMVSSSGGVDHGTDPIPDPDDPSGDALSMLLGRVFEFDSPIIYDPSPWRRTPSTSVGEIRLPKPGNKTEEGGSARWERVLQHDFELIVRGEVKYSLPLMSSMRSAPVNAKIQVSPNDDGNNDSKPDIPGNGTYHTNVARSSVHATKASVQFA